MFEKNDKLLSIARVILNVVTWIGIIGGILTGIILCCIDSYLLSIGLSLLFALPVFSALSWLVLRLILNFFCDVKLIRNKLYETDNDNLSPFLTYSNTPFTPTPAENGNTMEQLLQLKKLLDSGVITQEEFDVEKAKILKNM